jgi:uncharacterized membrane protein YeaQ/YmgE (transglycosylase-associated protein family)
MGFLGLIIFGLVIGVIARLLMPGPQPMGIILTAILGIAGSFLGGAMGNLLDGKNPLAEPEAAGWIGSLLGACLILFLYGKWQQRHA